MRIDWEGEVKYHGINLYVHADYKWDYDDHGRHVVVVTKARAWEDTENEFFDMADDFEEYIADIIQDEMDNAA